MRIMYSTYPIAILSTTAGIVLFEKSITEKRIRYPNYKVSYQILTTVTVIKRVIILLRANYEKSLTSKENENTACP